MYRAKYVEMSLLFVSDNRYGSARQPTWAICRQQKYHLRFTRAPSTGGIDPLGVTTR